MEDFYKEYCCGRQDLRCMDCDVCTRCLGEYYMVNDDVWLAANPNIDGMLCLTCLEERLGRELKKSDFKKLDMNTRGSFYKSEKYESILPTIKDYKYHATIATKKIMHEVSMGTCIFEEQQYVIEDVIEEVLNQYYLREKKCM